MSDLDLHPVDPAIRGEIEAQLRGIEAGHGVRILYACESGSRGWGFASPDSDYDVRFIYAPPLEWYLTVFPGRDVIELPINAVLDISGWELRKALALLRAGNATLIEWLDSPIVYRADPEFLQAMRTAAAAVFRPERSFHHYLNMARNNHRRYLQGETVLLKKYLYVLRPILAALWVVEKQAMPPMAFEHLVAGMISDPPLLEAIAQLLEIKRAAGEAQTGQSFPVINAFIETQLQALAQRLPPRRDLIDGTLLDALLRQIVLGSVPD